MENKIIQWGRDCCDPSKTRDFIKLFSPGMNIILILQTIVSKKIPLDDLDRLIKGDYIALVYLAILE